MIFLLIFLLISAPQGRIFNINWTRQRRTRDQPARKPAGVFIVWIQASHNIIRPIADGL